MCLVVIKGGSPERFKANLYIFMYTFFGSLFLLLGLVVFDKRLRIRLRVYSIFLLNFKGLIWLILLLVFFIKIPMFRVHLWLPKAHVEAPVEGSIMLAGVLLKLGGFGLIRIILFVNLRSLQLVIIFFIRVRLIGSFLVRLICLRQIDVKRLIAYSSVRHIGLLLRGLLTFSKFGMIRRSGMIIAHGFCSRCIFYIGNFFYRCFKTRNLLVFKGIVFILPFSVLL